MFCDLPLKPAGKLCPALLRGRSNLQLFQGIRSTLPLSTSRHLPASNLSRLAKRHRPVNPRHSDSSIPASRPFRHADHPLRKTPPGQHLPAALPSRPSALFESNSVAGSNRPTWKAFWNSKQIHQCSRGHSPGQERIENSHLKYQSAASTASAPLAPQRHFIFISIHPPLWQAGAPESADRIISYPHKHWLIRLQHFSPLPPPQPLFHSFLHNRKPARMAGLPRSR